VRSGLRSWEPESLNSNDLILGQEVHRATRIEI
jgi:hypothetical protein